MEKFKFTKKEMNILKKALRDLIEIGLSEPQENYIRNIDTGLPEEGQGFDEQIFYYFMPISQIASYGILSLENVDFLDLIFTEVPENVLGEFSYITSRGEKFSASCSMADDF